MKMAAMEGDENDLKGLLNVGNIVLQPDKIESAIKNTDSTWTYLVRWKDIWLHEALCMNFTDLIEEYWQEQKGVVRFNENSRLNENNRLNENSSLGQVITQQDETSINENQDIAVEVNQCSDGVVVPDVKLAELTSEITDNNIQVSDDLGQVVIDVPLNPNLSGALADGKNRNFLVRTTGPVQENSVKIVDSSLNYGPIFTVEHKQNRTIVSRPHTSAQPSTTAKKKYNPVQCDVCEKVLSSRNSLREHRITVHFKNGKFPCDQCDKRFTHQRALKLHKVMHTAERNFVCEECGSTHKRKRELLLHLRDMHTNTQNYRCDVCFTCFKMKAQLKQHCFKEHENTVTNCIVCKHKLTTPFSIYTHCLKHYEPKEFPCEHCGKAFKNKPTLKKHLPVHDPNRKPFKECPKCGKVIYSRSHYYEHVQSHDRDTNQLVKCQCKLCDSAFLHSSSLKRHMLRHRPGGDLEHPIENPYLHVPESELPSLCCRLCRKFYTSTSGYYDHVKKCRDGVTISPCQFCTRTYASVKTLRRHIRQRHPDEILEERAAPEEHRVISADDNDVDEQEEIAIQIIALAPSVEESVVVEGEFPQDDENIDNIVE